MRRLSKKPVMKVYFIFISPWVTIEQSQRFILKIKMQVLFLLPLCFIINLILTILKHEVYLFYFVNNFDDHEYNGLNPHFILGAGVGFHLVFLAAASWLLVKSKLVLSPEIYRCVLLRRLNEFTSYRENTITQERKQTPTLKVIILNQPNCDLSNAWCKRGAVLSLVT